MATISACLVVYHDQERIEACLESIAAVVDEIVVVHDGACDDATVAIARRYPDTVLETEYRTGDADFVRPFALQQCGGDWVLIIPIYGPDSSDRQPPIQYTLPCQPLDVSFREGSTSLLWRFAAL